MAGDDDELAGAGGLGDVFAQLEKATELMQSAAAEASATIVEGSAGDGRVVVQLTGDFDAVSVRIDPALVDPSDVGMLEDLVLAAIRDGLGQLAELQEEVAGAFGGGSGGIDVGALLGNLGNLAGLGGLGSPGSLGSFDVAAMAQLPGFGALGGLAGLGRAFDEDDHEDEDSSGASGGADSESPTATAETVPEGGDEGPDDDGAGLSGLG